MIVKKKGKPTWSTLKNARRKESPRSYYFVAVVASAYVACVGLPLRVVPGSYSSDGRTLAM